MPAKKKTRGNDRNSWSRYYDTSACRWPFSVRSLGYNRCKPGMNLQLKHPWHHWFDEKKGRVLPTLTLVHVLRGGGGFRSAPSGELEIPENSLVFAFPGVRHHYWVDAKTGWDDEWLEVDADALRPVMENLGVSPACPVIRLGSQPRMALVFRRLFDLARHGVSEVRLAACAYEVISTALDEVASCGGEGVSGDPILAMVSRLSCDDNGRTSIREATRHTGLSISRMRSVFREKMGVSPKQYQLRVRLERASKLLAECDGAVAAIAEQVGFKSAAAFSTAFAKAYGMSPMQYRRRATTV